MENSLTNYVKNKEVLHGVEERTEHSTQNKKEED
jgi:hypothetical protein